MCDRPTVPSTPADYAALFWTGCLVLVIFGAVCLYVGYRAPPEKIKEGTTLIRVGYGLIAGGGVMVIARRVWAAL